MDYKAPPWQDCPYLVERLCAWLNGPDFKTDRDDEAIVYGIIKSVVCHLYIAWVHPFGDGNGRTARALEVRFLMEVGVPSSAGHLLSNHYNHTRSEYYRRLQEASKSGGDITNFVAYAVHGFTDQLRAQLMEVKAEQWSAAWRNYVHDQFGANKSVADKRQVALLLALPEGDAATPIPRLRRLTPELAELYARKTTKTLTRDVNRIVEMGLAERVDAGLRARREVILAFLPRMTRERRRMIVDPRLGIKEADAKRPATQSSTRRRP